MEMDPVCNMEVNEQMAKYRSVYKGKTYYFCAPGCKVTFDENPEKYLGAKSGHNMHSGHSCCC
jgi:YHS domain-containing protein